MIKESPNSSEKLNRLAIKKWASERGENIRQLAFRQEIPGSNSIAAKFIHYMGILQLVASLPRRLLGSPVHNWYSP